MSTALDAITTTRIVAVIRLEHYDRAIDIARALQAGGISVMEFTLTGSGALAAIAGVREALGGTVCVGVGSVVTPAAAIDAIAAGAHFVVTPVLRPTVIEACRNYAMPILCGGLTPSELLTAHELGADMVKLFPARLGGPAYLRNLLGPLPQLRVVPTGGVSAENARDYLDAGAAALGIGGNLVPARAVAQQDWAQITSAAQAIVAQVAAATPD
jgi:2-dehydro-3-deoxyphosphogluconate aldolase/(4S)-4-hydroxy-2-oxoglutarate aldolase